MIKNRMRQGEEGVQGLLQCGARARILGCEATEHLLGCRRRDRAAIQFFPMRAWILIVWCAFQLTA